MHRTILMAGTIIASTLGFALAGMILGDAIRNSRRRPAPRRVYAPRFIPNERASDSRFRDPPCRGYDTPELYREDTLARTKKNGSDRDYQ
jgi:hypothetical protein